MLERIVRSIAVAYKDFEDVFNVVSSSKILRQQWGEEGVEELLFALPQ